MKHIIFIDPLEKLSLEKDSSMLFAATLKEMGEEAYFLFEEDFYFHNFPAGQELKVHAFHIKRRPESFYLDKVELGELKNLVLDPDDLFHIRLDPPFDARYMRYLWMFKGLQKLYGLRVLNDPLGVMGNNEKIAAYERQNAVNSFVGASVEELISFARKQRTEGHNGLILKPLDLFQGIGVEKISLEGASGAWEQSLATRFSQKIQEYKGPVVAQPFLEEVEKGEVRTLFFGEHHLGSILKVPPEGEFLANIAQGAEYSKYDLPRELEQECLEICRSLKDQGVWWVAFDILADKVQEINLTCPGLLIEVSQAHGKNLAVDIVENLKSSFTEF